MANTQEGRRRKKEKMIKQGGAADAWQVERNLMYIQRNQTDQPVAYVSQTRITRADDEFPRPPPRPVCQEQQPGGLKRPHPGRRVPGPHPGAASMGRIEGPHPGAARSGGSLGERQPGGAAVWGSGSLGEPQPGAAAAWGSSSHAGEAETTGTSRPVGAGGRRGRDNAVGHFQRLQRDPCAFS